MNVSNIAVNNVSAIQNSKELTQDRTHQQMNRQSEQHVKNKALPKEANKKEVKTAVDKLNDFVDPVQTNLKFVFHEDLNEYYVTLIDPLTKEVIREIPPKKMLDMYAAMTEYMGILVDKKI